LELHACRAPLVAGPGGAKGLGTHDKSESVSFPRASHEILAQSVVGLAAKAVNEGRGDEMVWVATDNVDVEDWFARWLKRHPEVELRGTLGLWELANTHGAQSGTDRETDFGCAALTG